jgi:hypothetical protein
MKMKNKFFNTGHEGDLPNAHFEISLAQEAYDYLVAGDYPGEDGVIYHWQPRHCWFSDCEIEPLSDTVSFLSPRSGASIELRSSKYPGKNSFPLSIFIDGVLVTTFRETRELAEENLRRVVSEALFSLAKLVTAAKQAHEQRRQELAKNA